METPSAPTIPVVRRMPNPYNDAQLASVSFRPEEVRRRPAPEAANTPRTIGPARRS